MSKHRDEQDQTPFSRSRIQEQLKANYRRLEDDFKQKEKRMERAKDKLKTACVQLSLAAEGQDERFDELLLELRKSLQTQEPGPAMLSRLEAATQGLAAIRRKRAKQLSLALTDAVKQLRSLSSDEAVTEQLNNYLHKLSNDAAALNEYGACVEQYTRLQTSCLSGMPVDQAPSTATAEMVNGDADAKAPPANTETAPPANTEKAPPMNTDEAAPVISLPEFSAVADSIECTLLDMLDKMTLSSAAEKELETLRATIDAGLNWYELAAVLEQLGGLVLQVLDRDHGDIEKFLQGLNERLADVNEQLQRASQRHEIFADHTEQFTVELRNDIDALQAELDEEKAIDTLKDAVSTQVEQMSDRLNQYNEEQQEHAQELTSEISRLQEKIKTLETEAKENQRLLAEQVEKSLLDALTQLPNREAYDERITTEFARWQRYRRPLSLAVVDVDHFKSVNDNYGHMAGDNVLRILANTLTKRLRRTDYIARYGGEEFVILMPETGLADAMHVMEQVREKVAETPFHFKSEPLTITVSCGLASFNEGDSIEQVFERADEQLYAAKNGGRNQCRAA